MMRLAQVGLGEWGQNWAQDVLPQVADAEMVAWVDTDPKTLAAARAKLGLPPDHCFTSLEQACAATDIDGVIGVVALTGHEPVARTCLGLGKHLLLEKPFVPTAETAAELARAARSAGIVLHVSQNYRFYPAVQAARGMIRDGSLGKPLSVDIEFARHAPSIGYRYWDIEDPLLSDMSIHHLDLMRLILGCEPAEVSCWTWNPPGSPFVHDPIGMARIRMTNGAVVCYRGSWLSRLPDTPWAGVWRIECEDGLIRFTSRSGADASLDADTLSVSRLGGQEKAMPLPAMDPFGRAAALRGFLDAVAKPDAVDGAATAEDNVHTIRFMEAIIRSAAEAGKTIAVG